MKKSGDTERRGSAPLRGSDCVYRLLPTVLLAALLTTCGLPLPVLKGEFLLLDGVGRAVTFPAPPQRIVSLAPSVTEVLYSLDAAELLVGVTEYSDYPPQALSKPRVGRYDQPSLEGIVALRPDLVVAAADSHSPALVKALEDLGIATFVIYPRSLRETLDTIGAIARITGREEAGHALVDGMERYLRQVKTAVAGKNRPRVLLCAMVRPLTVCGPRTIGGELIAAAGGENVVPDGQGRYPTWNLETLAEAAPEIILAVSHAGDDDPAAFFTPLMGQAGVVRGQVHVLAADWVHRPGPRLLLGLWEMARALHGIDLAIPETVQGNVK
ncbi:MAG: ABC transporter substrate-binding protein [Desulfuromonadaceae bacterium]|nr:ABC transporter substrate-binding protein [Desulfuromonadaceae bacterium]